MSSKVAVLTATFRHGGLDVNYASLIRQTYKNIVWIVGDDIFDERVLQKYTGDMSVYHFKSPERKPGYLRNLTSTYNKGMDIARDLGCDIFISMQDYMWIPDDGIEKFVNAIEEHRTLVTGLTSLTVDPTADKATHLDGLWTVFDEPYKPEDKPEEIVWHDVRANMHPPGLDRCDPEHFENNWSAWPLKETEGIYYDEEYDEHAAYENQDFAWQCLTNGVEIKIDCSNHALGLPHKRYYPQEEIDDGPHCIHNQRRYELKWALKRMQTGRR